jgi:hypothetical protein
MAHFGKCAPFVQYRFGEAEYAGAHGKVKAQEIKWRRQISGRIRTMEQLAYERGLRASPGRSGSSFPSTLP